MKNVKHILFDLDGTLTASDEGIIKSVQHALSHFGITETDNEKLKRFVGPPLRAAFTQFYGFTPEQTETAVTIYRERYSTIGLFENRLYEGIETMLKHVKEKGYTIVLATSKPRIYAKHILEHFNISEYFTHVVGCELNGTLDTKIEVMQCAVSLCKDIEKSHYIMVGDRFYDIDGAKALGIKSIGVLYGYGTRTELEAAGADYICSTVDELIQMF